MSERRGGKEKRERGREVRRMKEGRSKEGRKGGGSNEGTKEKGKEGRREKKRIFNEAKVSALIN